MSQGRESGIGNRESTAPGALLLREYRETDFDELVALDRECFEPGIAYSNRDMRLFLSFATRVAILAERDGRIVGFCIGFRAPGRRGHIITLDVRAGERGTGVGKALLEATVERMRRSGVSETTLEVDVENANAIGFYERLGFQRKGTLPDYYGPNRPALEMARRD
jgi:ribosomal protein S18 acetylase RimI-like enzyme